METLKEYKLPSGEVCVLTKDEHYWHVEMFDTSDISRWMCTFSREDDALKEFERWRS